MAIHVAYEAIRCPSSACGKERTRRRSNMSTMVESMDATVRRPTPHVLLSARHKPCRTGSWYTTAAPCDFHGTDAMQVDRSMLIGGNVLAACTSPSMCVV